MNEFKGRALGVADPKESSIESLRKGFSYSDSLGFISLEWWSRPVAGEACVKTQLYFGKNVGHRSLLFARESESGVYGKARLLLTSDEIVRFVRVAKKLAPESQMTAALIIEAERLLEEQREESVRKVAYYDRAIEIVRAKWLR